MQRIKIKMDYLTQLINKRWKNLKWKQKYFISKPISKHLFPFFKRKIFQSLLTQESMKIQMLIYENLGKKQSDDACAFIEHSKQCQRISVTWLSYNKSWCRQVGIFSRHQFFSSNEFTIDLPVFDAVHCWSNNLR